MASPAARCCGEIKRRERSRGGRSIVAWESAWAPRLDRIWIGDRPIHEMRRFDVSQLHKSIVDDWHDWVHPATTSGIEGWDNNMFLKENVPLAISVRYGQNQCVCQNNSQQDEAEHWNRLHQYSRMRSMTIALATHIQCASISQQM